MYNLISNLGSWTMNLDSEFFIFMPMGNKLSTRIDCIRLQLRDLIKIYFLKNHSVYQQIGNDRSRNQQSLNSAKQFKWLEQSLRSIIKAKIFRRVDFKKTFKIFKTGSIKENQSDSFSVKWKKNNTSVGKTKWLPFGYERTFTNWNYPKKRRTFLWNEVKCNLHGIERGTHLFRSVRVY